MRSVAWALPAFLLLVGCGGGIASSDPVPPGDAGAAFFTSDPLVQEIDPFPVVSATGEPYDFPFLGGYDVPRPQLVDIDGDGDLDLFLQKYRGQLMFFENVGTPTQSEFVWRTSHYMDLDVGEWARFHDIDGDGDPDLFMELPSSYIRYMENVGTPEEARFEIVGDSLFNTEGRPIFADAQNIPHFFDVDCNGRSDLFLGRIDGTVARFELAHFEDRSPVFELVTERFEDIEIVAAFGVPGEPPPLDGTPLDPEERPTLHGANSMAFADWDGDGAPDLFWGDFFEPGVLLIENVGSCAQPNLFVEPRPIPASPPLLTSGYNSPTLGDLNGDGHVDLLVGVLGGAFNANSTAVENLLHYSGSADGTMILETSRFLFGLDVGSESVPAIGDLTGNGLPDLLVGSKIDPTTNTAPPLYWYRNVGSIDEPAFEFASTLDGPSHLNSAPVLADLTGNGVLDLLVGSFNDGVSLYRNRGTAEHPEFVLEGDGPIIQLTRGSYSSPTVGDLNGNGLLDLVVGESSGEINHYRNAGTPERPEFELVTDQLAGIDVGSRSAPLLVDVDGDGDLDLLVGEESRGVIFFENIGTPEEPQFDPVGIPLDGDFPRLAVPRLVDIDGDGDLDMILGDQGGGLVFLRNRRETALPARR